LEDEETRLDAFFSMIHKIYIEIYYIKGIGGEMRKRLASRGRGRAC
jgi:hypothetical protein